MKHSTLKDFPEKDELHKFLNEELDMSEVELLLSRIKQNEPYDDFSAGVKEYLENHQYNYKSIIEWSSGAKKRANQKLIRTKNEQYSYWAKIAAILILSLSVYWIYQRNFNESDTWKKYYSTDPGFPVYMSGGSSDQWMQTYRAAQYAQTLEAIDKKLETNPLNDTLLYYKLVCLFETDLLIPEASYVFPKNLYYLENSKLLIAYSYWRKGNDKAAYLRFNQLSNSPVEPVSENSKKVLKAFEHSN